MTLTIPPHITGYPNTAFGGYIAGLLAARTDAKIVRVDFRAAVPVGVPVQLDEYLTARPAELLLEPPEVPSWAQAQEASEAYLAHVRRNPQPFECFGCSPLPAGKGIRLFPSTVPGRDLLAAAWVPDLELASTNRELPPEIVWAALDCPGGWAGMRLAKMGPGAVTAALTGTQLRTVKAGEPHISYAWLLGGEGRKVTVGVGLATAEGELCALAEALWIKPRK